MNKTASRGDKVLADYEGRLEDGTLFDTSIESVARADGKIPPRQSYAPLSFTVGAGQMIAGFDRAVVGMAVGQEKTVKIPPGEAYGEWKEANVASVPTSELASQLGRNVSAGMTLYSSSGATGKVVSTDANVTKVDMNHQLAGKTLVFRIILRGIG